MSKKFILILSLVLVASTLSAYAGGMGNLPAINGIPSSNDSSAKQGSSSSLNKDIIYYPYATMKSVKIKYKTQNYTGCIQELLSLTKKQPNNALAYYYMGLTYTRLGLKEDAISAYQKVIDMNPNEFLVQYATKGRDCITGGPACQPADATNEQVDDLDRFINAPYGNGLSPELNQEVKQKQLNNIKETINKKEDLDHNDIKNIKKFDKKYKSFLKKEDSIKIAQVSDEEVLNAVNTLKEAGLNVTVQAENPYNQMNSYQDPKMAEMSMLLGGNNSNNGNMMNMMPMLMNQAQKGENIDPRFMQAMMMNSMMSGFDFNSTDNK